MAVVLALAVCVGVIAALGKPETQSDAVRQVVESALGSDRAADCTRLYTQQFLDQVEGEVGEDAIDECRSSADDPPFTKGADVSSVHVGPENASAIVRVDGGDLDGSTLSVELVREHGAWRLDQLLDVHIDRHRFDAAEKASAQHYGVTSAEIGCWLRLFDERVSTHEVELSIRRGNQEDIADFGLRCFSAESLRQVIETSLREDFARSGNQPELADCVFHSLFDGLGAEQLRHLLRRADADPNAYDAQALRAFRTCQLQLNLNGPGSS